MCESTEFGNPHTKGGLSWGRRREDLRFLRFKQCRRLLSSMPTQTMIRLENILPPKSHMTIMWPDSISK